MGLSKFSEILAPDKEGKSFLALKIESDQIKSAFWAIEDDQVRVLTFGTEEEWGGTKEELMVSSDASISSAVAKLPEFVKEAPRRLILGVPNSWTKDNKILEERLKDLHFSTNKLSLQPLGFVVNPEAISYYLKKKEGEFISAILVYLGTTEITVSLISEGRTIQSEVIGRSDNFALDVEEGILRFTSVANLPPRILLYNSEDLELARQTLISYPWQPPEEDKPGFLHLPRVEILPKNFDIEAIAFAGGEEIKKSRSFKGEQIKEGKKEEKAEEVSTKKIEFVKGEDILVSKKSFIPQEEIPQEESRMEVVEEEEVSSKRKISFYLFKQGLFSVKRFFQGIFHFVPPRLFESFRFARWLSLGVFFLIILVILSFYCFSKAEVFLTVATDQLMKEFEFHIDPKQEGLNLEQKIIPARESFVEVNGNKTSSVTGKKIVGEKAKGEIIIYNRTDSPKTFPFGVILVGAGKLKFTLDQEVKVASKTPDFVSVVDRWGEAKAQVTAVDIGAQYNIAGGSQFYFENLPPSSFLAKNLASFSGGTSRQISVVAKEDQEKLLSELEEELGKKAREELEEKISLEEDYIWETLNSEIISKKFDHEIQEESSSLTLDLTLKEVVLSFKRVDLMDLALVEVDQDTGRKTNWEIEKEKSEISFSVVERKPPERKVLMKAKAKIVLKQSPESGKIVRMIRGKSISKAQKSVLSFEGVKQIEIKISPGIFNLFSRLPFRERNIFIISQTD